MGAPVQSVNQLANGAVQPGGTTTWRTVATDPDADVHTFTRTVTDAAGNVTVFTTDLTVNDPLIYGTPTCDDPKVTLTVDPNDVTLVHVSVAT